MTVRINQNIRHVCRTTLGTAFLNSFDNKIKVNLIKMTSFKPLNSKKYTKQTQIQTPDSLYWKKLSVSEIYIHLLTSKFTSAQNSIIWIFFFFLTVSSVSKRIWWHRIH